MKKLTTTTNRGISGLILCAFMALVFFTPSTADAGWVDNSDKLPGMYDGPSIGTILLVGVGIVGMVLLFKGMKKDNIEAEKAESSEKSENESDSEQTAKDNNEKIELAISSINQLPKSNLGIYLNCDNINNNNSLQKSNALDISTLELQAGLAFNF